MKKLELTDEQIKDIMQDLQMSMIIYIHKQTKEKVILPDEMKFADMIDDEVWKEEKNKIGDHEDEYFVFEGMSSRRSYNMMEEFIETVNDKLLKQRLNSNRQQLFEQTLVRISNSRASYQQLSCI